MEGNTLNLAAEHQRTPVKVTHFFRTPMPGYYSIERVFSDVRSAISRDFDCRVWVCPWKSIGIWRRLGNILVAPFYQGAVNHITGDVHYIAIFMRKSKTLLTVHDCVCLRRAAGLRRFLLRLFWYWLPAKRSRLISVCSESTKRELLSFVTCSPDKIRVVYNPVSEAFQAEPLTFRADKPQILHVGTTANKNLPRVAEALSGVPCHLRIIGTLSPQQRRTLEDYGVEYSSAADLAPTEIVAEYRRCDLVLFVSTYEGFGLPILEGQAVGRPVIASSILSMPEVAGEAACLVDPYDVPKIRQAVLRVIHDTPYREELVRKGFENVKRFRPQAIADQYAQLYHELCSTCPPR